MRTKNVVLLLLFSLVLSGMLFSQTGGEWYQNKPIRQITFEGLRSVDKGELNGLFGSYVGKPFSDERYWEILQKLYALEYFDDIAPIALPGDPDKKTVLLQFTVKEKPVVRKIVFIGNKQIRPSELLEKISLKQGDIYNELKARMDERAVREHYLTKGFASSRVTVSQVVNEDKSINLTFTVEEGKKTVVSSINFEGNRNISSKTLKGALSLKEEKLFSKGLFTESMLEADKAALRDYYTERGYVDVVIENVLREVDSESNPEENRLKLTFVIKEGDVFTYGGTTLSGNRIFSNEELLSKIRISEGEVMNLNRFNRGYQALLDVYFENGYTANYINKTETRDNERKRISYTIVIVENDRSHIQNIIIRGNTKTKDYVIAREFAIEEGDIFSKTKLISSIRNLYNLRYFSTITPDVVQGSEQNLVDIIVNVEEQSTASIQFGVTFSGVTDSETFPLSVFLQWQDTNFKGLGKTVSANVTASTDTQSLTLGYTENWFLGSPLSVSFNLSIAHKYLFAYQDSLYPIFDDDYFNEYGMVPDPFTSYEEYMNASSLDPSYRMKYEQWKYGLGISTGYRWLPSLAIVTLRGGLNFSVMQNYYDDQIYRPADRGIRDKHGQWSWGNSVWTRLSLDHRDINYDPSTGWFASQQVTLNGIIPTIESEYYVKFETKLEKYFTLVDYPLFETWNLKIVLAGFTTIALQTPVFDSMITESSKLFIDGMFNGRGWIDLYSKSSLRGNAMLSHTLELRAPVAPGILSLDFFFDAVAIKDTPSDLSNLRLDDYYMSFGPGLRFSIQQFPLRLLFANTFRILDGEVEWSDGSGPNWKFVLSFNIANL